MVSAEKNKIAKRVIPFSPPDISEQEIKKVTETMK